MVNEEEEEQLQSIKEQRQNDQKVVFLSFLGKRLFFWMWFVCVKWKRLDLCLVQDEDAPVIEDAKEEDDEDDGDEDDDAQGLAFLSLFC